MDLDSQLLEELAALESQNRLRNTRPLTGADRIHAGTETGCPLLTFCSNDYLGMANHPALAAAAIQTISRSGFGAGAARLVSGETPLHRPLEHSLAQLLGVADALLFPTGYQANVGVITSLAGPDDLIVSDAANHASIIDGCRLSRARIAIYPHLDVGAAQAALASTTPHRRRLLVTESIFSMDGDRAPLAALTDLARTHGAIFVVDEAHALGVAGPQGRGLAAALSGVPHVLVATLGKAMGSHGGFAAGSSALRSVLMNRARSFIYTTAAPPSVIAAAAAGLACITSSSGQLLRDTAYLRAAQVRRGLARLGFAIPGQDLILPLILGADDRALAASAALLQRGILVPAIRPPTVPAGTARLRITISAAHTPEDVDRLLAAISEIQSQLTSTP